MLNLLLAVLLLPVVAINVIGPWLVLRTQRIPARVRFNNTDHATETTIMPVRNPYGATGAQGSPPAAHGAFD